MESEKISINSYSITLKSRGLSDTLNRLCNITHWSFGKYRPSELYRSSKFWYISLKRKSNNTKSSYNTNTDEDAEKLDFSHFADGYTKWKSHESNITWPSICIHGHLSQRNENTVHAKTCTWKLTAALSLIAKKQQKLSSIGEWLNKQQYIHTMQ